MRKWLLRIGLVVGSPLLVLLLIELVWHMIGDPRIAENEVWLSTRPDHFKLPSLGLIQNHEDPEISFRLTPGFRAEVAGNKYEINSHGMRGEEVPIAKPAGTRRILVLGDSYAFGFGVDQEDTIATQLQRTMKAEFKDLQVLNMGVPGYQTGQELKAFAGDGMRFSPDVVILIYYANDNVRAVFQWDPRLRLTYVDELPLPRGLKHFMARSILYAKITKSYTATIGDQLNSRGPMGLKHNWPTTSARLQAMQRLCQQHGVALVFVALPALSSSAEFIDPTHDFNVDHNRVIKRAAELGLPTVDFRASLLRWALSGKGDLPDTALASPTTLRSYIAKRLGQPASKVSVALVFQTLEALKVAPRPIESVFVGPERPKMDSHLNSEGYGLLVREVANLIRARKLLR